MYKLFLFSLFTSVIKFEAKAFTEISKETDKFGYKSYPGVGWVHYNPVPVQWAEARLRCFYEGAQLMSPVNDKMQKVMSDIGETSVMWTGVHATYSKGNYFSIDGVPLSAMPITWAKDEPNNENNNEDCMIMLPGGNMADCSCNETFAFSCYKPNNFKTHECGAAPGYELDNRTKNCYKFHTNTQTWVRAFMICAAEGAHLAVIDSPGEQKVLQDLTNKYPVSYGYIHLGYRDWQDHSLWITVNGKNIDDLVNEGITTWENTEPNNKNQNEYCGSMTRGGSLNDISCQNEKQAFICEIENKQK
ncbi:hypothetical protein K1T71_008240 [Dendrolimus kikuchii]|uniref:Uncharacterized protein n=1 Tax=Dendrolimus kikuchii TaxID=765133 RepID=A0ACC1CWU2_9NEOP|nr:hypothetical protein K1T71_008240 [Dendrolimus kikuchii]